MILCGFVGGVGLRVGIRKCGYLYGGKKLKLRKVSHDIKRDWLAYRPFSVLMVLLSSHAKMSPCNAFFEFILQP